MRTYEITYLTVKEETPDAATIAGVLKDHEAKIVSVHPWGNRRKLAFPIQKQDQAFFTTVVFDADPSVVQPIENALKLNPEVLRSLLVLFEPGFFHRAPERVQSESTDDKAEKTAPAPVVEPIETVVAETPAEASMTTTEEKPKKRATKKAPEDDKSLDEKLDELLKEDIVK